MTTRTDNIQRVWNVEEQEDSTAKVTAYWTVKRCLTSGEAEAAGDEGPPEAIVPRRRRRRRRRRYRPTTQ